MSDSKPHSVPGKPPYRIAGAPSGIISADDWDATDEALEALASYNELVEQYQALHAAAVALLESADDQTYPDDGFPLEEWLNLVDTVRGSNPAKEPK